MRLSFERGAVGVATLAGVALGFSGFTLSGLGLLVAGLVITSAIAMHLMVGLLDLRRVSLPAMWYFTYLLTVLVPGLVVASERDHPNEGRFLFAILSVLVTGPLGILVASRLTGFRRKEVATYFARPVESTAPSLHWRVAFGVAVLIAVLFVGLYLIEVPSIPILFLLRNPGALAEAALLREESFKLLDSPFRYLYEVVRKVGFPMLVTLALGQYLGRRQFGWKVTFLLVAALGVFFASLSLAKAPVALIVLIACFYWYLHRGGRLSLRLLLGGTALVLSFPLAVLLLLSASSDVSVWKLLAAIMRRLFVMPAEILYAYFEILPDRLGFLHGRTIGRVAWLLGEPPFNLSNYVYQYLFPTRIESGAAPSAFVGFFYADFGMIGVVLGGIVAGAVFQAIHVLLLRRPKTVPWVAAYAFMYWAFWQANLAPLPQTLLSGGVIIVLAGVWLLGQGERLLGRATASVGAAAPTG
jgi:oligosaccharide repeat unit polymerase